MAFQVGTRNVDNVQVGSQAVAGVFVGSNQIWPTGPSSYDEAIQQYAQRWYYVGDYNSGTSDNTLYEERNQGASNGALLACSGWSGALSTSRADVNLANPFTQFPAEPNGAFLGLPVGFTGNYTPPAFRGQNLSMATEFPTGLTLCGGFRHNCDFGPSIGVQRDGGFQNRDGLRLNMYFSGGPQFVCYRAGDSGQSQSIGTSASWSKNTNHWVGFSCSTSPPYNAILCVDGVFWTATNSYAGDFSNTTGHNLQVASVSAVDGDEEMLGHRLAYIGGLVMSQAQLDELWQAWVNNPGLAQGLTNDAIEASTLGIDQLDPTTWPEKPLPGGRQILNPPQYLQDYWDTGIKP